MKNPRCRCCRQTFTIKRNPLQRYCSKPACQKVRRKHWLSHKYKNDADYRSNKRAAQQSWRKKHPTYYRSYRSEHSNYVERNRLQQKHRNQRKRYPEEANVGNAGVIAKTNALLIDLPFITMPYDIFLVEQPMIAKMNAFMSKNHYISINYDMLRGIAR